MGIRRGGDEQQSREVLALLTGNDGEPAKQGRAVRKKEIALLTGIVKGRECDCLRSEKIETQSAPGLCLISP